MYSELVGRYIKSVCQSRRERDGATQQVVSAKHAPEQISHGPVIWNRFSELLRCKHGAKQLSFFLFFSNLRDHLANSRESINFCPRLPKEREVFLACAGRGVEVTHSMFCGDVQPAAPSARVSRRDES